MANRCSCRQQSCSCKPAYLEAKRVVAKTVEAKKVEACQAKITELRARDVRVVGELDAHKIAVDEIDFRGDNYTFKNVEILETLTVPAGGLLWTGVAQVNEPVESALRSGARATEDTMSLDFMIPVAAPTLSVTDFFFTVDAPEVVARDHSINQADVDVAGKKVVNTAHVVCEKSQVVRKNCHVLGKLRVGKHDSESSDSSTSNSDDDLVVQKCARIRKCLKVHGDAVFCQNLHVLGTLTVDGAILKPCPPAVDAPVPEGFCEVKCKCPGECSSSSSCCSSSSCGCESSSSCGCDSSSLCSSSFDCFNHEEIDSIKARLAALEALVATLTQ